MRRVLYKQMPQNDTYLDKLMPIEAKQTVNWALAKAQLEQLGHQPTIQATL